MDKFGNLKKLAVNFLINVLMIHLPNVRHIASILHKYLPRRYNVISSLLLTSSQFVSLNFAFLAPLYRYYKENNKI